MENEGRPHETGQHLLGPHVVGQRVVIRRVVPGERGPTGGPAMTDLLGECIGWADGVATVRPESGPAVDIPISDIVSGKPVPPRPSIRQRVSVAEAEAHTAGLFPDVETAPVGAWTLRCQPAPQSRLRRRANSCLAVVDPGLPPATAADQVQAFYAARSRTPYLHVEADSDVEVALLDLGWTAVPTGDAEFMLASLARVRRHLARDADAELTISGDRATAAIGDGCDPLGEAQAVLDGDWLGMHDLAVDPGHRRRGHATNLVAAILEWGAEQGATNVWLHVETDNDAARALYEGLGFLPHHRMRYLTR